MILTAKDLEKVVDEREEDFVKLVRIGGKDVALIRSGYVVSLNIPDELIEKKWRQMND